MTTQSCGCATTPCNCCEGTRKWTPMSEANRPGLDALRYRVGTHGAFLETMKARLSNMTVDAFDEDSQATFTYRPLQGLTVRDTSDPSIALLDGWATVADVLTFYQERIANEGYLRTATQRRSVLELARLVGYTLRPGVAASVYLAYTLEDKQIEPVEIPIGTRSQSIPGPDEFPQSFETSEKFVARTAWNNLQVRLTQPQNITLTTSLLIDHIYVDGITTNLNPGDSLLLVFGDDGSPSVLRKVLKAEGEFIEKRTKIKLQPVPLAVAALVPSLSYTVQRIDSLVTPQSGGATSRSQTAAHEILDGAYLGLYLPPETWAGWMMAVDGDIESSVLKEIAEFAGNVKKILDALNQGGSGSGLTDPSKFVNDLLKPPVPQAANSLQLGRSLSQAFDFKADTNAQLLVNFSERLKDTFYTAWANANVNGAAPVLKGVFALRMSAPLFGASVPKQAAYYAADVKDGQGNVIHKAGQLKPPSEWDEWSLEGDETTNGLFLDQAHDAILQGGYVLLQDRIYNKPRRRVFRVTDVQTMQRTGYGISGKTTQLALSGDWWRGDKDSMYTLRSLLVYGQSEQLTLIEEPVPGNVDGQEVVLDGLYNELTSGRWVIFSGERADIEGVDGVKVSELLMISGLQQDYNSGLPGDTTHTRLQLATQTAYTYKRDTLTIYGNVVKATHGETRMETMGSGDGSISLQSFGLKQPPLTFVSAPTVSGVESTLSVYVNNVEWHETDTLAGLGPKDRNFVTETSDDDKVTVTFGNGEQGSRLPTGVENVQAIYRQGIGKSGNVNAEQISLLLSRPLGVKSVINPLRASGGADKESRDQARDNAPLAVMALDRLVSTQDYADFTRTFAGIAKADAKRLSDGRRELVYLTIAGADDIPIDATSDLYRNLLAALRKYGDAGLPLQVDLRELLVLALSAKIRLLPDYQWEPVATTVRATLLDQFGFHKRALGQPALLCEVISAIQNVRGVAWVDVDAFGGIPEKTSDEDGTRRLLTLDELAETVQAIVDPEEFGGTSQSGGVVQSGPAQIVNANQAGYENGALRPAQLAIFSPAVPDTIVLNQIT